MNNHEPAMNRFQFQNEFVYATFAPALRRLAGLACKMVLLGATAMATTQTLAQTSTTPAAKAPMAAAATTAKAIFAGGCFWCVESDFDKLPGVISTTSGYIGGKTAKPTYDQVSAQHTGHAEAVEIVYDPGKVSYSQLVEHFWFTIDPTTKDQQFCDRGSPYRTAIFAQDAAQLKVAQDSRSALEKSKPFKEPVVTEVVLATAFYPAEEYHQDYYKKNPLRYKYYRTNCGRDARLKQLWGDKAAH